MSPEGGSEVDEYLAQTFGGSAWGDKVVEGGREDGLGFENWVRWPNSVNMGRALELAKRAGGADRQWLLANSMFR